MRIEILAGLALSNSLTREIKESNISEIRVEDTRTLIEIFLRCSLASKIGARDLYLERDIVSFVYLGFILAVFFIDLDNIDIAFLYLADSLQSEDRILKNFLLSLLLLVFLLLAFLLLALTIVTISAASGSDVFLEKAPV